jgi:hypothetical protein
MTLVEALVGTVLALLLLGVLYNILIPTIRAATRLRQGIELQQSASMAMVKMSRAFSAAPPAGVSLADGGRAVAIHSKAEVDPNRRVIWDQQVRLLYQGGDRIYQADFSGRPAFPVGLDQPYRLASEDFAPAIAGATRQRPIADDVASLVISTPGPYQQPLYIELELVKPGAEPYKMRQAIYLRNTF